MTVFSGLRFSREAKGLDIPVVLTHRGRTRANGPAGLRLEAEIGGTPARVAELSSCSGNPCGAGAGDGALAAKPSSVAERRNGG
jgi:hypothetical protein